MIDRNTEVTVLKCNPDQFPKKFHEFKQSIWAQKGLYDSEYNFSILDIKILQEYSCCIYHIFYKAEEVELDKNN